MYANKRIDFIRRQARPAMAWSLLTRGYKKWKAQYANIVNKDSYGHNHILECRRNVELGSRLRLARLAFRHPIRPPHTPEMEELGLTKEMYRETLSSVEAIRQANKTKHHCYGPHFIPF
ncbi:hypothetical protein K469DRAFT_384400 [Zopfia rhizophila CBS 207.26]|uniref:Uncharacterized protein n=1 Tax=Zopfia rhizophila CBS 207.26 TaxID=1314779 RepID=A0A6A6EH38_9PEZI|nr:hypothetical protein K469DRAFT_384400 [Zopfia rhizophila CBS 207.26]